VLLSVTFVTLSLKPTPYDQIAPDVQERSDAWVLFSFFASAFILRSELSGTSGTEISQYPLIAQSVFNIKSQTLVGHIIVTSCLLIIT